MKRLELSENPKKVAKWMLFSPAQIFKDISEQIYQTFNIVFARLDC